MGQICRGCLLPLLFIVAKVIPMLTRRHFVITSAALFSAPLAVPAFAQDAVSFDFDSTVVRHERARPVAKHGGLACRPLRRVVSCR